MVRGLKSRSKRARTFDTPVARFRYLPIPERAFAIGVARETTEGGAYLVAQPEKALCDRIAQAPDLDAQREVPAFFFGDLRIEADRIDELDPGLIGSIAAAYRRKPVSVFARWMAKRRSRQRIPIP